VPDLLTRVLAIGAAAAIAPVPVLVVLVLLAAPGGLTQAWWFVLGFAGSLLVAGGAALFLASTSGLTVDHRVLSAVGLALGIVFLVMAARLALGRRRGAMGHKPLTDLAGYSASRLVGLGVVAGALNPKTLPIFLTGVAAIAVAEESLAARSLALVLLTGAASLAVALPPVVLQTVPGERTAATLRRVRAGVECRAHLLVIVLLVVAGLAYLAVSFTALR
jgi:threonine/homoserine/homoserine lactone efflux protein